MQAARKKNISKLVKTCYVHHYRAVYIADADLESVVFLWGTVMQKIVNIFPSEWELLDNILHEQ